jgi:hypothetical protein
MMRSSRPVYGWFTEGSTLDLKAKALLGELRRAIERPVDFWMSDRSRLYYPHDARNAGAVLEC